MIHNIDCQKISIYKWSVRRKRNPKYETPPVKRNYQVDRGDSFAELLLSVGQYSSHGNSSYHYK
jgi:hypothetical protein